MQIKRVHKFQEIYPDRLVEEKQPVLRSEQDTHLAYLIFLFSVFSSVNGFVYAYKKLEFITPHIYTL